MPDAVKLEEKIESLEQTLIDQKSYILQLEEHIRHLKHKQFGASSEKISADQLALFNEAEVIDAESTSGEEAPVTIKAHTRQSKPRVSIPEHYPREVITYDLDEADKVCPHDQTPLKPAGSDDHEQLAIIPAQIKVIVHQRLKYACPCCESHVVTASKPKQPIEKSIASPSLLAYVATQKFCDALPLYRQSAIFKRSGIHLDRANLANWMIKVGELFQPMVDRLHDHINAQPVVHMDETTGQVLKEPDKSAQTKSYFWLMASFQQHPAMVFHYDPGRSSQVVRTLLSKSVSALMCDGYSAYDAVCAEFEIILLGCMAHARRKFIDAQKLQPKGKVGKADHAIAQIATLYRIEKKAKDLSTDERYRIRQEEAKPILDELKLWLDKSLLTVAPKTKLGLALSYLSNQWLTLVRYIDHGDYPIDNNPAENAIRPFVIGRKNWLFSVSQAGAKASANIYSIIETAKANQLNPQRYLEKLLTELPNLEEKAQIDELLPWVVQDCQ
ncbi:IS66 family transposase [bacterium]|nr:IS66 family transposase [bacterium]